MPIINRFQRKGYSRPNFNFIVKSDSQNMQQATSAAKKIDQDLKKYSKKLLNKVFYAVLRS